MTNHPLTRRLLIWLCNTIDSTIIYVRLITRMMTMTWQHKSWSCVCVCVWRNVWARSRNLLVGERERTKKMNSTLELVLFFAFLFWISDLDARDAPRCTWTRATHAQTHTRRAQVRNVQGKRKGRKGRRRREKCCCAHSPVGFFVGRIFVSQSRRLVPAERERQIRG